MFFNFDPELPDTTLCQADRPQLRPFPVNRTFARTLYRRDTLLDPVMESRCLTGMRRISSARMPELANDEHLRM
jgi:hypothetical protein